MATSTEHQVISSLQAPQLEIFGQKKKLEDPGAIGRGTQSARAVKYIYLGNVHEILLCPNINTVLKRMQLAQS
jgi:hypothetical protein